MVGTGKGAENGILIKGGEHLEMAYKLTAVVLDKTGTITKGKPEVTDIIPIGSMGQNDILVLAAIAEKNSEHPLGAAIFEKGKDTFNAIDDPEQFEAIPVRGIKAVIGGRTTLIGTRKLMAESQIDIAGYEGKITSLEDDGKTAMLMAVEGKLEAIIAVADTIKETSREAITELQGMGIEVYMLTGDNKRTANAILGFLNPIIAGGAMAFSSVSVVTNSLSLKRFNGNK